MPFISSKTDINPLILLPSIKRSTWRSLSLSLSLCDYVADQETVGFINQTKFIQAYILRSLLLIIPPELSYSSRTRALQAHVFNFFWIFLWGCCRVPVSDKDRLNLDESYSLEVSHKYKHSITCHGLHFKFRADDEKINQDQPKIRKKIISGHHHTEKQHLSV